MVINIKKTLGRQAVHQNIVNHIPANHQKDEEGVGFNVYIWGSEQS